MWKLSKKDNNNNNLQRNIKSIFKVLKRYYYIELINKL